MKYLHNTFNLLHFLNQKSSFKLRNRTRIKYREINCRIHYQTKDKSKARNTKVPIFKNLTHVHKVLQPSGFSSYHEQKIPKRSMDSEKKGIQHSRELYKLLLQENRCLIMYDETYVKKDFAQVSRQFY